MFSMVRIGGVKHCLSMQLKLHTTYLHHGNIPSFKNVETATPTLPSSNLICLEDTHSKYAYLVC